MLNLAKGLSSLNFFSHGRGESILINELGTDKTWLEYTNYIIQNNLTEINDSIIRNEGLLKSLKNDN